MGVIGEVITINGVKFKQVNAEDQSYFELKELKDTVKSYKHFLNQELEYARQHYENMKELGLSLNMLGAEVAVRELSLVKGMVDEYFGKEEV